VSSSTPNWQDGYRDCIADVEAMLRVWIGCARLSARKCGNEWDEAIAEEGANVLDNLLRAVTFMANAPKRTVDFDDVTTDVTIIPCES
jgi:hypothetical protein